MHPTSLPRAFLLLWHPRTYTQAIVRCLYAYLMDLDPTQAPHIPIPLHTVIELLPGPYGCEETKYRLL